MANSHRRERYIEKYKLSKIPHRRERDTHTYGVTHIPTFPLTDIPHPIP